MGMAGVGVAAQFLALATAAVVSAAPLRAEAAVTAPAKVRYETQDGRSRWYEMEFRFLTGQELNEATSSFRYAGFSNYAVIFFGQGQAAVIKLKTMLFGCSLKFTASCFPSIGNMKGEDQDGTAWEICTSSIC